MDILRISDLRIGFTIHGLARDVVKGVSLRVPAGKTVALVGESGSGKSVISQAIMGLLPRAGAITGGEILFRDPLTPETSDRYRRASPRRAARSGRCAAAASA